MATLCLLYFAAGIRWLLPGMHLMEAKALPVFAGEFLTDTCGMPGDDAKRLLAASGMFWEYCPSTGMRGGHYQKLAPAELRVRVLRWMQQRGLGGDTTDARNLTANVQAIINQTELPPHWLGEYDEDDEKPTFIAARNGLISVSDFLKTGHVVVKPPSNHWFSETALAYDVMPNTAKPFLWMKCLREWMCGDMALVGTLQEFAGYCLADHCRYETALFLEGTGGNGKSVFLRVLREVLGPHNVTSLPLTAFGDEFGLVETYGKLANIATETDPGRKIPVATLRQIISGEELTANRKYLSYFSFRPTLKIIVAWNNRPVIDDRSDALWRRALFVPFRARLSAAQQDTRLAFRLMKELSGVLVWALEGLKRLTERGRFDPPLACAEVTEHIRLHADPLSAFVSREISMDPDGIVLKDDLHNHYQAWAIREGEEPFTKRALVRELCQKYVSITEVRRLVDGRFVRCLRGFTLRKPHA